MLINPTAHPDWLPPHSLEWYSQIGSLEGKYSYSWNSSITQPNGESIFDADVLQMIKGKKVLDIGCGDGGFTIQCGTVAKEIVGFDATEKFTAAGSEKKRANVSFVTGNTKHGLPVERGPFDCAFIRKGPTSAYLFLKEAVKEGGMVLGLHPGDELGKELPLLFPNFFDKIEGTPTLDHIRQRLEAGSFTSAEIEHIKSIEYLHSPFDVIKWRCFGQKPNIYKKIIEDNLSEITRIFEGNSTRAGLPITFSRYIVRISV
ncbi:bifunctional 2-polyprenyl-6-hydroxyphenol methylase/3-demethylubiquinol 3-O-methyltransferase UbiG [Bacillus sp. FJAT-27445]|uniref:class I SAM-dependent methyltransferase n=1 Tax=Bacillus sp. FJAT-27445 TaxID=1679166 RepID=UPI00074343E2|nr:class I SAM-dependent methyltransferase [Bacillus sp. FJAT-27445]